MSSVYRTIHWDEPVRKVRYFVLKAEVDEYKKELQTRGLKTHTLEVDKINVDGRARIVKELNEAIGYGEVMYGGQDNFVRNMMDMTEEYV